MRPHEGWRDEASPLLAALGAWLGGWAGGLLAFVYLSIGNGGGGLGLIYLASALGAGLMAAGLCLCDHYIVYPVSLGRVGAFLGAIIGSLLIFTPSPVGVVVGSFSAALLAAIAAWGAHSLIPKYADWT